MYDLIIFLFETGDSSCPYWQELALVDHEQMSYVTLEDSIASYMESEESEDKDHEDMVADILNESGWPWMAFTPGSNVHNVHTFWV